VKAFTHDLESVELSDDEISAFARIVRESCLPLEQAILSESLELIAYPGDLSAPFLIRTSERMWRKRKEGRNVGDSISGD
jgi:hypothetical protein